MKRNIVWLLVSCLMVAVLLVTSCSPAVTKEEEVAPPEEEIPTFEEPFRVGETAKSWKLEVTVTEIYLAGSYEYYDKLKEEMSIKKPPAANTIFLFTYIKIKNVASEGSYKEGAVNMWGGHSEGGVYSTSYLGENPLLYNRWLSPGDEMEGKVVFVVAENATDLWVKYRFSETPAVWAQWRAE